MNASPWDPSSWGGGRNHWKRVVFLFKTQSTWRPCAPCLVAPLSRHLGDLLQSWVPSQFTAQGDRGVQRLHSHLYLLILGSTVLSKRRQLQFWLDILMSGP